MSYVINDNFGQRAYMELQDVKKDLSNVVGRLDKLGATTIFKVFGNAALISKQCSFVSTNNTTNVNIYNVNDTNSYITIYINNIKFYQGIVDKVQNITFNAGGRIELRIVVDNPNENYVNLDIVATTVQDKNSYDSFVVQDNNYTYLVARGFSETYVFRFESMQKLNAWQYDTYYIMNIDLLDAKVFSNYNGFIGRSILVIGLDTNGDLILYSSEDGFQSGTNCGSAIVQATLGKWDDTCILYAQSGVVKCMKINGAQSEISDIKVGKIANITNVYVANDCRGFSQSNLTFVVKTSDSEMYLVVNNTWPSQTVDVFYLGNFQLANTELSTNKIYMSISDKTEEFQYTSINSKISNLHKTNTYIPCNRVQDIQNEKIMFYRNLITEEINNAE